MAITYTPTTNFGAKDSLPTNDPDKVIKGSEFTTEFTALQTAFSLAAPNASPTFTGTVTIPTADINGGAIDGTVIGGATPAAGSFTALSATGNITVGGTVDGRDVAADGTKLDGIEAGATADQTAAEIRALVEAATDSNVFTDADHTKLNGIEALADVTDTANVTAAGALMDSELTNIAAVKALDQGVATTDSPSFAGLTATGSVSLAGASTTADITFGDDDKAIFGASNDLQIYHDGSGSYVQDTGQGYLYISASNQLRLTNADATEEYIRATVNGAVDIKYDNATKLATTATGIDVTGTVTADGLTVNKGADGADIVSLTGASAGRYLKVQSFTNSGSAGAGYDFNATSGQGAIRLSTANLPRLFVGDNGDISFYEDTGTTPKFFWDASAEALGIGTSSPSEELEISAAIPTIRLTDTDDSSYANIFYNSPNLILDSDAGNTDGSSNIQLRVDGTERMRITSAGNVGIGRTNPSSYVTDDASLYVKGQIRVDGVTNTAAVPSLTLNDTNSGLFAPASNEIAISTGAAERMRIDSSGNLLVGKTSAALAGAGTAILATGTHNVTVDGDTTLQLNRLTSDGALATFFKDGTAVGSIGTGGGSLDVYSNGASSVGLRLAQAVIPMLNGATSPNTVDLGTNTRAFKDLYLSGGVYLGGTGAANLLDDYEEGTFTPELADASSGGNTATITSANGWYTKVGNLVSIGFRLSDIDTTGMTSSNAVFIRGLPFASSSTSYGNMGSVLLDRVNFTGYVAATQVSNSSYILLQNMISGSQDANILVSAITTTGSDILISLQYKTA